MGTTAVISSSSSLLNLTFCETYVHRQIISVTKTNVCGIECCMAFCHTSTGAPNQSLCGCLSSQFIAAMKTVTALSVDGVVLE